MEQETRLFEVRFTEHGKKFIRKFVAISYTIMVLVFFESAFSIYWSIRVLVTTPPAMAAYSEFTPTLYDMTYPYISILLAAMGIVSNFYYIRFPRVLLRSIELNDESGANQAFNLLFKGALIFLVWLLLNTTSIIWSLIIR